MWKLPQKFSVPLFRLHTVSYKVYMWALFYDLTLDLGDNSAILHKVEGIVIKWVHQVKNVLDLKSGQAIIDGKNPGPGEELKFWSELSSNLQCIYDQLVSPKVQKMARLLKDKESSYYQSLVNMFDDVRVHLEEARDISMHLKARF